MTIFIEPEKKDNEHRILIEKTARVFFKKNRLNFDALVNIHFVSSKKIALLNRKYRHIDQPTDVLCLPLWEEPAAMPKKTPVDLGDIFVSEEMLAKKNRQLADIIQHSLKHLIGKHH